MNLVSFISPVSVSYDQNGSTLYASQGGTKQAAGDEKSRQSQNLKTGQAFEVAFIAQMLKFSGLGKALVSGGGKGAEEFTQFYLEGLAKEIMAKGGFGIASKIDAYIKQKEIANDKTG